MSWHGEKWQCPGCRCYYTQAKHKSGVCKDCRRTPKWMKIKTEDKTTWPREPKVRLRAVEAWQRKQAKPQQVQADTRQDARLPTDPKLLAHMRKRQNENRKRSANNPAETWMEKRLKETGMRWFRNSISYGRIYDFWNPEKGIAVEVDGVDHDEVYDATRDQRDYKWRGILVLRVNNFNEKDADEVVRIAKEEGSWKERKQTCRRSIKS